MREQGEKPTTPPLTTNPSNMTDSNRKTGDQAELLAINYLQKHEYEVIETNFVASK